MQHRGGPLGFIKVLDDHTLGLADFPGNAQYISLGNLSENPQAFMFLMDYPNRHRIKIWGTAEFVEGDADLLRRVSDPDYAATPERALRFHVTAWSPNCALHITQRFTAAEMAPDLDRYRQCIASLEAANATLRSQIIEAGLQPEDTTSTTERPNLSAVRSSDHGGCAPSTIETERSVAGDDDG